MLQMAVRQGTSRSNPTTMAAWGPPHAKALVRVFPNQSRETAALVTGNSPRAAGGHARFPCPLGLNRRARHGAERAKHAAVAGLRLQHRVAASALVEELARVGRHGFRLGGAAVRARNERLQDHQTGLPLGIRVREKPRKGVQWYRPT